VDFAFRNAFPAASAFSFIFDRNANFLEALIYMKGELRGLVLGAILPTSPPPEFCPKEYEYWAGVFIKPDKQEKATKDYPCWPLLNAIIS